MTNNAENPNLWLQMNVELENDVMISVRWKCKCAQEHPTGTLAIDPNRANNMFVIALQQNPFKRAYVLTPAPKQEIVS